LKNCRRFRSPVRNACTLRNKSKIYIDIKRKGETKT